MTNLWAIETSALRKSYGRKEAVADLTLQVPRGEIFGFLGPNGAGKSTAIKMLLGLVRPSGGAVRVLGLPPGDAEAMARIGFLPEHFRFHEWLRATEFLDLHGQLFGLDTSERRRRIPELLELVGLSDQADKQLSGFSKGMIQRIGLAQALLSNPELVFLDEPTSALDPFGRMLVRGIIRELKSRGTTVFLNSHLLSEVESVCDRVSFVREGRVLKTLALRDLDAGQITVELEVDAVTPSLLRALDEVIISRQGVAEDWSPVPHLSSHNGATAVATLGTTKLQLTIRDEEMLPMIASRTLSSGARLYALTPRRVSLEEIFLDIVGREDSGQ